MHGLLRVLKNKWFLLAVGIVLGAATILAIRFAMYQPTQTHYHANFAVYINGKREMFASPTYYQEVTACDVNGPIQPVQRAHMHDEVNSVVHVHDDGVTWGQFFENLGWYIGPDFIQTRSGTMYKAGDGSLLHISLNGQDYTGLAPVTNMLITDRARLLVSYGDISDSTVQAEYKTVASTAKKYDESKDPASCGAKAITTSDRLHHLF